MLVSAIPEDPEVAEEFYHEDGFESCSDENLETDESNEESECSTFKTYEQVDNTPAQYQMQQFLTGIWVDVFIVAVGDDEESES